MRLLTVFLVLVGLALPARAEGWHTEVVGEFASPSGDHVVVVTSWVKEHYGHQERLRRGALYRVREGSRELVWETEIAQGWTSEEVLVPDGGQAVVVLVQGQASGYWDDAVAIHGPDGAVVARRPLDEVLGARHAGGDATHSWWRKDEQWIDGDLFLATEVGVRAVRLSDGTSRVPTGAEGTASLRNLFPRVPPAAVDLAARDPASTGELVRVLEEPQVPLPARLRAAVALADRGDRRGADLVREATASPDWHVSTYALEHLPRVLPSEEALPLLLDRLVEPEIATPDGARRGLVALGPQAVGPLVALLQDPRAGASGRNGAARALGELKAKEALSHLVAVLSDPVGYVAESALEAVVAIAGPAAAADLERTLHRRTALDGSIARYFSRHPRAGVVPLLIEALEYAESHLPEDPRESPRGDLLEALRFQTGLDLGNDSRAWRRWLETPEPGRTALLLELGDPAGLLQLDEAELLRRLPTTPRLAWRLRTIHLAEVSFLPDGTLVLGNLDGGLSFSDPRTGEHLGPPSELRDSYRMLSSPDGARLVTVPFVGPSRLLDRRTGKPLGPALPDAAGEPVRLLDRERLLTVDEDGVMAWDAAAGRMLYRVPARLAGPVVRGEVGAAVGEAQVTFFGTRDGRVLRSCSLPGPRRETPLLTRDGRHLVLDDASLPVAGGASVALPRGPGPVAPGAGSTVFLRPSERRVQAFSAATGQPVGPAFDHEVEVTALAVSPDEQWLATGCSDGSVRLWNLASGTQHGLPMRLRSGDEVIDLGFRGDGAWLGVVDHGGVAVYDLRPEVRLPEDPEARRAMLRAWVGVEP